MIDISRWAGDGVGLKGFQIKSIQHVEFIGTPAAPIQSVTINEVVPENCMVFLETIPGSASKPYTVDVFLYDSTTVKVSDLYGENYCAAVVVEFQPWAVKSYQSGTASIGSTAVVISFNEIDWSKAFVAAYSGYFDTDGDPNTGYSIEARTATSITMRGQEGGYTKTVTWRILELR